MGYAICIFLHILESFLELLDLIHFLSEKFTKSRMLLLEKQILVFWIKFCLNFIELKLKACVDLLHSHNLVPDVCVLIDFLVKRNEFLLKI